MPKAAVDEVAEALLVRSETIEALLKAQAVLRADPRLYHDVELFLAKLQRNRSGPLTDVLQVLVGQIK